MSETCVFCKIVEGKIPSTRVMETETVLAFMDIGPIVKGHVLVIPKSHVESLGELPEALLADVMLAVQQIARSQVAGLAADGVNIHQANGAAAGQVVPHLHFHVIPRFNTDGHRWNWKSQSYANASEAEALAARLRSV